MVEYFSGTYDFKLLKNHINDDPICDWFEIQSYLHKSFNKDKNNYFKKYISKISSDYINNLIKNIIKEANVFYPNIIFNEINSINDTINKIQFNIPLIINPILINYKYNLLVNCHIMIKKELFVKIFGEINNIPLNIIKKDDYLIINIIPSILQFKKDLREICNNNYIFFNKCSLYAFNSALRQYTDRNNYYFLLGKDYKINDKKLNKKEYIGLVIYSDIFRTSIIRAIKWLNILTSNIDNLRISPNPDCIELFPNMNNKDSEWETEKKIVAERIKEITLIWRISYKDRNNLIANSIRSWNNPYLLNNLYEFKDSATKNIQEKIINMNKYDNLIIEPRKNISQKFKDILKIDSEELILDIESMIHLEEKTNYFDDNICKDLPNICIIGNVLLKNNNFISFKDYTIENLSNQSEKDNIINWIKFISKYNKIKVYHWGHAEKTYMDNIKKKFPDIIFPEIILIDLLHYFRSEPIIIKDCFNFSLKTIGKNMYKHGLIKTTWSDTDNGLDAMIKFKEICLKKDKNIPIKRYSEISEIIEYNKMDCVILMEILQYLRKKYL